MITFNNKMKFKEGRWYEYKHPKALFYLKCRKSDNNRIYYSEYINTEKGNFKMGGHSFDNGYVTNIEVPVEKLQQYLSDDHPDKIKNIMKYSKGKIKFKNKENRDYISNFYTNSDGIPEEKIIYGSTELHKDYDRESAEIVDFHNEYYIVKYKDCTGRYVQLGFKEEDLEPFEIDSNMNILLEEAKKRYPIGTTFTSAGGSGQRYIIKGNDFAEIMDSFGKGEAIQERDTNGLIWVRGKWAEIISLPAELIKEKEKKEVDSWGIQLKKENSKLIRKYFESIGNPGCWNFNCSSAYYGINEFGNYCCYSNPSNYIKILTLQEFKDKFNLNKEEKIDSEELKVGDWVVFEVDKCVGDLSYCKSKVWDRNLLLQIEKINDYCYEFNIRQIKHHPQSHLNIGTCSNRKELFRKATLSEISKKVIEPVVNSWESFLRSEFSSPEIKEKVELIHDNEEEVYFLKISETPQPSNIKLILID